MEVLDKSQMLGIVEAYLYDISSNSNANTNLWTVLDRARQDKSFGISSDNFGSFINNYHLIYQKICLDELYLAPFTDLYLHSNC